MARHDRIVLAAMLVGALSAPALAGRTYCCNDESGRRVCGDVLPAACHNRAHQIREGNRTEQVATPLTQEQMAQREAEQARKKEEERRAAEERRANQALLSSYASEKDFDSKRDRAIDEARKSLDQASARFDEATRRRMKLSNEAEFYRKKPMPEALKSLIRENETELSAQQAALNARKQDIENIRATFEVEKNRYLELTRGKKGTELPRTERPVR